MTRWYTQGLSIFFRPNARAKSDSPTVLRWVNHDHIEKFKRAPDAAGPTPAEVSRRCGIDQPAHSRLETGPTRTRRWTRFGVALRRSGGAWS